MENIHVKIDFSEAVNAKKMTLISQMSILKILKKIQAYRELKKQELGKKIELKTKLKQCSKLMLDIKKNLPKTKMPEIEEPIQPNMTPSIRKDILEDELSDIQDRLRRLNEIN